MKTKTNINLIVNGTKVYTRKTTGRPYTHALVVCDADGKWSISSCSSKGAKGLMREMGNVELNKDYWRRAIAGGPNDHWCEATLKHFAQLLARADAARWFIVEIIENTVTVTT
jgi:hypothetical protein